MGVYLSVKWIIDGYNVIHSDPRLAKALAHSLEAGREDFLLEIQKSPIKHEKILVVFDGRYESPKEEYGRDIEVRYSARGQSADDLIRAEIAAASRRRSITVVSDDHAVAGYARECGAIAASSREFISAIRTPKNGKDRRESSSREKPESGGKIDEELLRLFKGKQR